jgi:hypothetical protein
MGDPVRINLSKGLSQGSGPQRPGFGTHFVDWTSGGGRRSTQTTYTERALERLEKLQRLNALPGLGEDEISKVVNDPTALKRLERLLSDSEIRTMYGLLPEVDVTAIRQDKNLTEIQRARAAETWREVSGGTHEPLEVEEKQNKFLAALSSLKDYVDDETILGKIWDGFKWVSDKVPGPEETKTPYVAKKSIEGVFTGMEKIEEFVRRHNVRADALRQKHGAASVIDQQEMTSEWSWGKRMLTTIPRLVGAMAGPGFEDYDAPGFFNPQRRWRETDLWIPFFDSQVFFSQTVRDLADLGIGSPEATEKFKVRARELAEETGDAHSANAQAFDEREDLSTFTKLGIELGSDPTVAWGFTLGGLKLTGTAVTAGRAAYGTGLIPKLAGLRQAIEEKDFTAGMKFRENIVSQIKAGSKSAYWSDKPGELTKFLDEVTEAEGASVISAASKTLLDATGSSPNQVKDGLNYFTQRHPWLTEFEKQADLESMSLRELRDKHDAANEWIGRSDPLNTLIDDALPESSWELRPLSWKIERAEVEIRKIMEDVADVRKGNYDNLTDDLYKQIADEPAFDVDSFEEGLMQEFVSNYLEVYLSKTSPRAFSKGNADDLLDFKKSPLSEAGREADPESWLGWLDEQKELARTKEKALINEYSIFKGASDNYDETIRNWDEVGKDEFHKALDKNANDPASNFWGAHEEKFEELVEEAVGKQNTRVVNFVELPTNEKLLNMIDPRTTMQGPRGLGRIIGGARRISDPSSEIPNMVDGSMDRTLREGQVIVGRIQDMGQAEITRVLNQLKNAFGQTPFSEVTPRTPGELKKTRLRSWLGLPSTEEEGLFRIHTAKTDPKRIPNPDKPGEYIWEVDEWEGRLAGIIPKPGHKGASLYFGDIAEISGTKAGKTGRQVRDEIYSGITPAQHDFIDVLQQIYKDIYQSGVLEQLDIHNLGEFLDGFSYVGRKTKGLKGTQEVMRLAGRRGKPGFTQTRFFKEIRDGVRSGREYYGPYEVLESYLKGHYHLLSEARLRSHLISKGGDWIKDVDVNTAAPEVVQRVKDATRNVSIKQKSIDLINKFSGGYRLSTTERNFILKAFPELTGRLNELFTVESTVRWDQAQQAIYGYLRKNNYKITAANLRAAIKSGKEIGGRNRDWMNSTDIGDILRKVGLDDEQLNTNIKGIRNDIQSSRQQVHERTAKGLQAEMVQLLKSSDGAEAELGEAIGKKKTMQEYLRTPSPYKNEAKASSMNLIFQGEDAVKTAKKLDQFLTGQGYGPLQFASNAADAIRIMKTGLDFGVFFIQGMPLLFRDPEAWGKAFGWSVQAFVDPQARAKYIAYNNEDIVDMVRHGGHLGSTEVTESMTDGGWFAKLAMMDGDNPNVIMRGIGLGGQAFYKTVKRFATQYDMFLDVARIETYKALKPTLLRHGTDRDLYELGDFVNKLTGHISTRALGVGVTQRQLESALFFFSPRYTRATAALFLDMTRGGLRAREARSAIASLMAGQYALHTAISIAMGEEPNYVPGKGNWLKTYVDGLGHVGFGGKPNAFVNMSWDIQEQIMKNPTGFLTPNVFDSKTYDDNSVLRRLRYQTSPFTGAIINYMTGADPIGRTLPDWEDIYHDDMGNPQFNIGAMWTKLNSMGMEYLPFAAEALIESGPVAGATEFFGGAQYPERPYETRDELYNRYANEDLSINLAQMRKLNNYESLKAQLENAHPDLKQAVQDAREAEREFGRNDERMEIRDHRNTALRDLASTWDNAMREFKSLGGSHRDFRKRFWEANKIYGGQMKVLREQHPQLYADMSAYYEGKGEQNNVQAATNAFMDRLFSEESQDFFGNTNYAAIDRIKADLRREFTDAVMDEVEENFTLRMIERAKGPDGKADPLLIEFIKSIEGLREYWEIGRGLVRNEEEWNLWLAYDNASEVTKEVMRRRGPRAGQMNFANFERKIEFARKKLQKTDSEIDRWLAIFYGKEPLHRINK